MPDVRLDGLYKHLMDCITETAIPLDYSPQGILRARITELESAIKDIYTGYTDEVGKAIALQMLFDIGRLKSAIKAIDAAGV